MLMEISNIHKGMFYESCTVCNTVFARVICALFSYFGGWKIRVRKRCRFCLWRSWSGFYSST